MSDVDWNDLRIVLAVAEHASLSKAARALSIHQTTCGRRLDRLERELGVRLFLRSRRGLVATAAAAPVLATAGNLSSALSLLAHQLGEDPRRGTVRLAVTENTALQLLLTTLPGLRSQHPGLVFDLLSSNAVADLARGEADLAVRLTRPDDAELVKRRLGWVTYGLYGSAAYLARRGAEQPQLAGDHVVMPTRELAQGPEAAWLRTHASAAEVALCASSMTLLTTAVEQGLGLAALPTNMTVVHRGLRLVRRLDEIPRREVWLAVHRGVRDLPRVKLVAAAVSDAIAKILREAAA